MLKNDMIVHNADEPFFDMDRVTAFTEDEFFGELELFIAQYELQKGFIFIRANGSKSSHVQWCTLLQDSLSSTDDFAWFEWNMDTGTDHTDVIHAYGQSLPDKHYETTFEACKLHAGVHNLEGIDAVVATNPGIPVFVFIKGYLKAGKTIATQNISAVIDLPSASENVTSLVQGLVGRCCGYGKNEDLLVFTDETCVKAYADWVSGVDPEALVKASSRATIHKSGEVHTLRGSAYYRK